MAQVTILKVHLINTLRPYSWLNIRFKNIEKDYNETTSEEEKHKNFMDSKFSLYELSKYKHQIQIFTSLYDILSQNMSLLILPI